jgi:hypothetical protein
VIIGTGIIMCTYFMKEFIWVWLQIYAVFTQFFIVYIISYVHGNKYSFYLCWSQCCNCGPVLLLINICLLMVPDLSWWNMCHCHYIKDAADSLRTHCFIMLESYHNIKQLLCSWLEVRVLSNMPPDLYTIACICVVKWR